MDEKTGRKKSNSLPILKRLGSEERLRCAELRRNFVRRMTNLEDWTIEIVTYVLHLPSRFQTIPLWKGRGKNGRKRGPHKCSVRESPCFKSGRFWVFCSRDVHIRPDYFPPFLLHFPLLFFRFTKQRICVDLGGLSEDVGKAEEEIEKATDGQWLVNSRYAVVGADRIDADREKTTIVRTILVLIVQFSSWLERDERARRK